MISLILTASLILGLVMIPGFNSHAASYPATTSFTYTYDGYDYQFYFSGEVDSPQDYYFDSSVLDYLINKASEGLNLSISSGLGAKIDWISGIVLNSVFDFYRNFVFATDKVIADWIVWTDIYGFSFEFTGLDSNYPGHETYGSAYGWRFTGWLGEKIDLVLDSQGMLYGSNPIGNYTFSDEQEDLSIWSIHQHDSDENIWYQPYIPLNLTFENLASPYIQGKSLYFTLYYDNGETGLFCVDNFVDTYIMVKFSGLRTHPQFYFYSPSAVDSLYANIINLDSKPINSTGHTSIGGKNNVLFLDFYNPSIFISAFCLPNNWQGAYNESWNLTRYVNCKGLFNNSAYGYDSSNPYSAIYLFQLSTTPLPDPIVLPVGDPVPVTDIQPDPIDFTPDPDEDPDPVPGIDYPVDPIPFPVPPLPPIVSGNDDLWPDLNDVFTIEADLDGFLGGLSNFQFTPLRTLVDGFTSALTWVSTIMMLLYDGSDFSILFVVLSVFFIAAALLGIYKWWTR